MPRPDDLTARFHALRDLLAEYGWLWRPAPFHEPRPAWCQHLPELAAEYLALDDASVEYLGSDNQALIERLARHVPALADLHTLIDLPPGSVAQAQVPERLLAHIPGRKQAQILAFGAAMQTPRHPLLEWCAGKGHLGRLIAHRHALPVTSLEIDAGLVADGIALARRAGTDQDFVRADALDAGTALHLHGRHVVALHACGDLHLSLLRGVVDHGAPVIDLVPCCYYRIATPRHRPLNDDAGLDLSREELHLAVTETVTAGTRQRRIRDTAQAWKLAFLEWRGQVCTGRKQGFKPIPAAWMNDGFAAWLRRLCLREGLSVPVAGFETFEQIGWQRLAAARRLELVRLAFRRALEIWLVLDRALYLRRAGFAVKVGEFCQRSLTPRNLMIQACRQGY